MKRLLETRSLVEQRRFFEQEISPLFDKTLRPLGDAQPDLALWAWHPACAVRSARRRRRAGIADVLHQRLERSPAISPCARITSPGRPSGILMRPGASGRLPPYLAERNFACIRERAGCVSVEQISVTDKLASVPSPAASTAMCCSTRRTG